jgi:hypothetical protein
MPDGDFLAELKKRVGYNQPSSPDLASQRAAIEKGASQLGVDPTDLASIISFESAGSFDPHKVGGEGNRYRGLIQFGPDEQKTYYHPNDTFESQIENGVVPYFRDRFKKAGKDTNGATLNDLYTTVIAGNPNANRNKTDSFGTSANSGVQRIIKEHRPEVLKRYGWQDPNSTRWADQNRPSTPQIDARSELSKLFGGLDGTTPSQPATGPTNPVQQTLKTPGPMPETQTTLDAQRAAANDPQSSRVGVLYTHPESSPASQNEIDIPVSNGQVLRVNRNKFLQYNQQTGITADDITSGKADFTPLIGGKAAPTGEPFGTQGQVAVISHDANGNELVSSAVQDPSQVPAEAALQKKQFPNTPIKTSVVPASAVIAGRTAATPTQTSSPSGLPPTSTDDKAYQAYLADVAQNQPGVTPMSREQYAASGNFGKGVETSLNPSDFKTGETPVTSSELEQFQPTQDGGQVSFAREQGKPSDDLTGKFGTYQPSEKITNPYQAYAQALTNVGSRYGLTPDKAQEFVDRLKSHGRGAFANEWQPGMPIAITGKVLEQAGVSDIGAQSEMEQARNAQVQPDLSVPKDDRTAWQAIRGLTPGQASSENDYQGDTTGAEEFGKQVGANPMNAPYAGVAGGVADVVADALNVLGGIHTTGVTGLAENIASFFGGAPRETASGLGRAASQLRAFSKGTEQDGLLYQIPKTGTEIGGEFPMYVGATALAGGNPILGMAGLEGLKSVGRGEDLKQNAIETGKGAVLGAIFHGAGKFGDWAGKKVAGKFLSEETLAALNNPALREAYEAAKARGENVELTPDLKRALVANRLVSNGTRLGVIGGTGTAAAKIEGKDWRESVKQGGIWVLQDMALSYLAGGKGRKLEDLDNKVVRVPDEQGQPKDVLLRLNPAKELEATDVTGQVPKEVVDAQILPSTEEMQSRAQQFEGGLTPEESKQITEQYIDKQGRKYTKVADLENGNVQVRDEKSVETQQNPKNLEKVYPERAEGLQMEAPKESVALAARLPISPINATPLQPSDDRIGGDTKILTDTIQSPTFREKGFNGLDVPTREMVVSEMLHAIHDPKVRDFVVQFVPVDVVDNLLRIKRPSQVLFHDNPVLKDALPANIKNPITLGRDTSLSLIDAVAHSTAKNTSELPNVRSVSEDLNPASDAVIGGVAARNETSSGAESVSNPTRASAELSSALGTSKMNRHGAEPPSESTVSGEPESTSGSPSILPQKSFPTPSVKRPIEKSKTETNASGESAGGTGKGQILPDIETFSAQSKQLQSEGFSEPEARFLISEHYGEKAQKFNTTGKEYSTVAKIKKTFPQLVEKGFIDIPTLKNTGVIRLTERGRNFTNIRLGAKPESLKQVAGIRGAQNLSDSEARKQNYVIAKSMDEAGRDSKRIWLATGWEKGKDGKWRTEIDDSDAKLVPDKALIGKSELREILDFPELYKAYPELKQVPVHFDEKMAPSTRGALGKDQDGNTIIAVNAGLPYKQIKSTLLHEIQHFIQREEGFPTGGSPEASVDKKKIHDLEHQINEYNNQLAELVGKPKYQTVMSDKLAAVKELQSLQDEHGSALGKGAEKYNRLAGEVEARNVQYRHYMTPEERAKTPLSASEDVDREYQSLKMAAPNEKVGLHSIYNENGSINYDKAKDVAGRVEGGELEINKYDPAVEQGRIAGGRRNVEASLILAGSERAIQETSSTSGHGVESHRRQEKLLEHYAKREGVWFQPGHFPDRLYLGKGGEAIVYQKDPSRVAKTIDYRHIDKSITPQKFLDTRISLFNYLFPESHYELMGFMRDANGKFRIIVTQPLIQGEKVPDVAAVDAFMSDRGFEHDEGNSYSNDLYQVHDLHAGNVLQSKEGTVFVVDAVPKFVNAEQYPAFNVAEPAKETETLSKVADAESQARLVELLPYVHSQDIMENAKFERKGDHLELNEEGGELLRRLMGTESGENESSFFGATHSAAKLRKLGDLAMEKAKEYVKDYGYTNSQVRSLRELGDHLRGLAKSGKAGITYVYDDSLPEETHHALILDAGGISPKAIVTLKENPLWNSERFDQEYPNASDRVKAIELAAKLETGQDYWPEVSEADKQAFLNVVADDIIDRNTKDGVLTLDPDVFQRLISYGTTETGNAERSETIQPAESGSESVGEPGGPPSETTGREGKVSTPEGDITGNGAAETAADETGVVRPAEEGQPANEAERSAERGLKERKTVQSAHDFGILNKNLSGDETRYYETKSNDSTERAAQDHVEKVGFSNAFNEAILAPSENVSRLEHTANQMAVLQILAKNSADALNAGNQELHDYYEEQAQAVMRSMAPENTDAGQAIQLLSRWKITNPATVINFTKMKMAQKGLKPEIPAETQTKLTENAQKLTDAQAKIDALNAKIESLEKGKRQYENKGKKTKPLTSVEKRVLDSLEKLKNDAIARLTKVPDSLKMVAWHGSPHRFDKFDISKIGTGEGAQAYGHGLYFTDKESIADHYKNKLASKNGLEVHFADTKQQMIMQKIGDMNFFPDRMDRLALGTLWNHRDIDKALAFARQQIADNKIERELYREIESRLKEWKDRGAYVLGNEGAKYKVDLKPEADEYLLWDKPLSEQSEKVKKGLEKLLDDQTLEDMAFQNIAVNTAESHLDPDVTGMGLYKDLTRLYGDKADVSDALHTNGIRGIKYLAGDSRNKGEGNYNYVIFDDKDVDILDSFKMAAPSPLADDIRNDLTDVGASILLEGWHGEPITPEQFHKELTKLVGKGYEAFYKQIHAESVAKMDARIKDEKLKGELDRLREANPDKSDAELAELNKKNKAETKEKNQVRAEHRKLANEFLKAPSKAAKEQKLTAKKIEDFLNAAAETDLFADDATLAAALARESGAVGTSEVMSRLKQLMPERFKPEASDTITQRKEKQRDLNNSVAEGEKLYKAVNKAQQARRQALRDQLGNVSPEARKELEAAKTARREAQSDLTKMVKQTTQPPPTVMHKVAQISRASKVALIQTAVTNVISTKIEQNIANKPMDVMDIALQRIFKGLKNEGLSGDASIATALWTPNLHKPVDEVGFKDWAKGLSKHEVLLKAIDEHPEYFAKFFGDFSPDMHSGLSKVIDKLMIPMRMQEFFMRDSAGVKALAQRAEMKGIDFKQVLADNNFDWVTKADLDYAMKEALSLTYALRPERNGGITDTAFSSVTSLIRSSGLLDLIGSESFPFLNFMWNTINKYKTKVPVMAQARLIGKTVSEAKRLKAEGEEPNYIKEAIRNKWTSRQIANQMFGVVALAAMYGIVKALGDRDEWYYFKIPFTDGLGRDGGSLYGDIRTQPLLAPFMFIANKLNRVLNGKDLFTYGDAADELTEAFLGTSYRSTFDMNKGFKAISQFAQHPITSANYITGQGDDEQKNGERLSMFAQQWLGNEFGTLTNFLQFKTMKDIAAQFDEKERKPLNLDEQPVLQGLDARVPESRRILQDIIKMQVEARKNYATDKEQVRNPLPALKVLGFNLHDEADLKPEPTQAEILAAKLAFGGDDYKAPELPDEKKKAAIKRDFRKAGEKLTPGMPEADALKAKLATYGEDLTPGQVAYAQRHLFSTDLQDHFEGLKVKDADRVWNAATPKEKPLIEDAYRKKLDNAMTSSKASPPEKKQARELFQKNFGDENLAPEAPKEIQDEFDRLKIPTPGVGDKMTLVPKGEKTTLSTDRREKYEQQVLNRTYTTIQKIMERDSYKNADDTRKKIMLESVINTSRKVERNQTKGDLLKARQ